MRNRFQHSFLSRAIIASAMTTVVIPACVQHPSIVTPEPPADTTQRDIEIRLLNSHGATETLKLEEYVRGTILAEVPLGSLPTNVARTMAEVQAIAARTYAVYHRGRHGKDGFDLCATTHCQVHRDTTGTSSSLHEIVDHALIKTSTVVVAHNSHPIEALFHADCGGATSSASTVWGGPSPPYLNGVLDRFCVVANRPPWSATVSREALRRALNSDKRTAVGRQLANIKVTRRDTAGRAVAVTIDGVHRLVVRGEIVRSILARRFGATLVKSTLFEIERQGNRFVFLGTGNGHGAGLCQIGAMARARAGHSAARILSAYYPGTTLVPLQSVSF